MDYPLFFLHPAQNSVLPCCASHILVLILRLKNRFFSTQSLSTARFTFLVEAVTHPDGSQGTVSGKETTLPPFPPLRTGLESFPSSGSSLFKTPSRGPVSLSSTSGCVVVYGSLGVASLSSRGCPFHLPPLGRCGGRSSRFPP